MELPTSMTLLLNKIERRLGTEVMNLPDHLDKKVWGHIIIEDTLTTFSRFFPHKLPYIIDTIEDKGKDGFYYIDQNKIPGDITILGIRDLSFERLATESIGSSYGFNHDPYVSNRSEDVLAYQMRADNYSYTNNGIYIEFIPPNKLYIQNALYQDIFSGSRYINIEIFVKHANSLATISPTKMETFEELAILDIEIFLYNGLKFFENIETVYVNIDLKIQEWQNALNDRKDFVEKLKDQYVSAANQFQPMIFTV